MTYPTLIGTAASLNLPRQTCALPPQRWQLTADADPFIVRSARSAGEVIQQVIDLLDPAMTSRLTELMVAPAPLQVPRYCFHNARGVEELCLILPPPGSLVERVFALSVGSDDTVRLGRACLPAGSLNEVRAQALSQREADNDALHELMRAHGRHLLSSLSACADVALMPFGNESAQQLSMGTLGEVLSESWVQAGDRCCDALGAEDLAVLGHNGISAAALRAALRELMTVRCADALNHLDYFEAGIENDPILSMWQQFLVVAPETDFVPSLTAYNYLVSSERVVSATRVAVWDDPAFMARVRNFARYQRAAEALLSRARGGL
jgi:hypothetical protein